MYHASKNFQHKTADKLWGVIVKWNHLFHESDAVAVTWPNRAGIRRLPIIDVVLTRKVWGVGNASKNLATLKQL